MSNFRLTDFYVEDRPMLIRLMMTEKYHGAFWLPFYIALLIVLWTKAYELPLAKLIVEMSEPIWPSMRNLNFHADFLFPEYARFLIAFFNPIGFCFLFYPIVRGVKDVDKSRVVNLRGDVKDAFKLLFISVFFMGAGIIVVTYVVYMGTPQYSFLNRIEELFAIFYLGMWFLIYTMSHVFLFTITLLVLYAKTWKKEK